MTAEVPDFAMYRGKSYSIAEKHGKGLFEPLEHGLAPTGHHVCGYAVREGDLYLDSLQVNLEGVPLALFGIESLADDGQFRLYQKLNHLVAYSGGLMLAADFINELRSHMGFHPVWKYREVHELVFHQGFLLRESDKSKEMKKLRAEIAACRDDLFQEQRQGDIARWIEDCFDEQY